MQGLIFSLWVAKQAGKQTVELPVIPDAKMLMWHNCNATKTKEYMWTFNMIRNIFLNENEKIQKKHISMLVVFLWKLLDPISFM